MKQFTMTKQKFLNQWLRHFAPNVPPKQLEMHVKGQYIWHVFSYKFITEGLLVGDAARKAFNDADKGNCICCDMFGDSGVTDHLPHDCNTAEGIDEQQTELYVVSHDWSWTYIKTHEGDWCGPYFMKLEKS